MLGVQYRNGLLDAETVYAVGESTITLMWTLFKPVIEEYRKLDYTRDQYGNWEYLANEMARMTAKRDPGFKGSKSYISSEEYERAFSRQSPQ
jgi:hypothetical protein